MYLAPHLKNWLAVYNVHGIGAVKFSEILSRSANLENIPNDVATNWPGAEQDLDWLATNDHAHIITLLDERYPKILKQIRNPPPVLYVLGDPRVLSQTQVAIVGSRRPSHVGLAITRKFAKEFSELGLVVTSGLARGIDAAAHRGALLEGSTVAVAAHGLDKLYPKEHKALAEEIQSKGCLVSEFPIGVDARAGHFPQRNRIISGLSLGVVVVEAAERSGSLITARYAVEHSREVFAVPGALGKENSKGCHQLIKQGAKLVESSEDVLEELASLLKYVIRDKTAAMALTDSQLADLNEVQGLLLSNIDLEGTKVDEVMARTGITVDRIGSNLCELELKGYIKAVPGGYARRLE